MGEDFNWSDLLGHLVAWRRRDFSSDQERDAARLETLEWVVGQMLEKLQHDALVGDPQ